MDYQGVKDWTLGYLEGHLSEKLHYHGKHHTLDVLEAAADLCQMESIDPYHTQLLLTAVLFHDIGFTQSRKEHEAIGCTMARAKLPRWGYTPGEVEVICGMIMATKIPQSPCTRYEQIICDADLDYLGRSDFPEIGQTLFKELLAYGDLQEEEAWNRIQVAFIGKHQYFTATNRQRREPQKQKHLQHLKALVKSYT